MKKVRQRCLLSAMEFSFRCEVIIFKSRQKSVNAFIHQQDINVLAQDDYQRCLFRETVRWE